MLLLFCFVSFVFVLYLSLVGKQGVRVLRYAVCRLVITLKQSLGDGQCHIVIP